MKTAVIIPIYNQERYLVSSLDALLAQTCSDWIAYCVNDGSTDSSEDILADYAACDSRFVVITQPNGGVSVARNTGIEVALANPEVDTICFSDPDDFVHPRQIEIARRFEAECPGQVVTWDFASDGEEAAFRASEIDTAALRVDDAPPTHNIWDKIYPKELLRNVRFLVGGKIAQDMAFSLEFVHKCHPVFRHVPAALTYYRIVPTSTMHRPLPAEYYERMRFVLEYMISIYDDSPGELDAFCREHLIGFLRQFRKYLRRALPEARAEAEDVFLGELRSLRRRGLLRFPWGGKFPVVREWFKLRWMAMYLKRTSINSCPAMLVVSLTSFPARIGFVHKTIETLLNQSMKADKVVLYLAKEQFEGGESSLPQSLLDLRARGLEIRWCEDLKSYKKLVPALREYPDAIVVTADDDILYPRSWLEDLYASYLKHPGEIHCHRAHRMTFEKDGNVAPYADWIWGVRNVRPSFNNFLTGVGGVLYPPNSLHEDVLNDDLFRRLCPTADDIWFWAMAVLKGSKINVIGKRGCELRYVEGSQEANCLQMINLGENRNDSQLRNVLSKYPEILGKLEKKPIKRRRELSFLEKLFSFKSQKDDKGAKYKVVTVFGIPFRLKTAKVVAGGYLHNGGCRHSPGTEADVLDSEQVPASAALESPPLSLLVSAGGGRESRPRRVSEERSV